jgi:murein DD-endopeptidase MepM/ murein hydrolase activator NlpD
MTQKSNPIQKPYHLSIRQALLIQGLTWVGGLGLLSSGVVLAQPAATETTAVPSAQELLTPAIPEVSRPQPTQVAPEPQRPEQLRPERPPAPTPDGQNSHPPAPQPQVSAPIPQPAAAPNLDAEVPPAAEAVPSVSPATEPAGDRPVESTPSAPAPVAPVQVQSGERSTIVIPSDVIPELQQNLSTPKFEGTVRLDNFNSYIDPTDYSIGATRDSDQPTVILSERSSGCETILANGQPVPANLCQRALPRFNGDAESGNLTAAAQYSSRPSSTHVSAVNVGPITLSSSGVSINRSGIQSYSPQNFFNLTSRPAGLPGNGNLRLMFPLSVPASITSAFGWRIHPIFGESRFHSGTDIGSPTGTPVLAAFSGQVVLADFLGGYGLTIVLQHGNGTQQTLYAHLSEIFVRPGEQIEQGQVLGRVGSTGNSTGPHLHFEVRQQTPQGWVALDPGVLLQTSLAQFWQNLQTAGRPQLSNLVALKDLSKASSVVGTAYSVFLKEDPSQLAWREIFDKEFAVPETEAIAPATPGKLSLTPVSLNQIPDQPQQ